MRRSLGWRGIALFANLPIALMLGLSLVALGLSVVDPPTGVDDASSIGPADVLFVEIMLSSAYLIAVVRFARRIGWLELVACDALLGAFAFVAATAYRSDPPLQAALLIAGVGAWLGAVTIAVDRRVRGRALASMASTPPTAPVGDPTPHQFGVFGGALLVIPLGFWLWSAVEEAQSAIRIGSKIPPAWLTLALVCAIWVIYLVGMALYVTHRVSLTLAIVTAGAFAILLCATAKQVAERDLVGAVSLGVLCAGAGVALSVIVRERRGRRRNQGGTSTAGHRP